MSIILKKNINEVRLQQAVITKENLPSKNNMVRDVRFVKVENKYFIFTGFSWCEIDLVIE